MAKDSGLHKGDRFGRLVVDSWVKEEQGWKCFCDCGSVVFKPAGHLKCGSVLSCGCYRRECDTFNGGTMSYEYSSFIAMHSRAGDKLKEGKLKRQYYDQGVRVCERWNYSPEGFQNFTNDLGQRPEGYTLERKNTNLGYCPENCCWETKTNQVFNRTKFRNNKSGVTGVSFDKSKDKWVAYIHKNKVKYLLGCFNSFEDAVSARKSAELEIYPEKIQDYISTQEG